MKRKFKVGDRVKCVCEVDGNKLVEGKYGVIKHVGNVDFAVEFDENVDGHSCMGMCVYYHGWWCRPEQLRIANEETIVIYRKGDEVIALDKVSGKTGVAKCGRNDTFDFATGARIAFERLLGDPKPEEPKYFTGKVVCTQSWSILTTLGKIYAIDNGIGHFDDGRQFTKLPVKSVDDLNSHTISSFLEIKED